MSKTVLWLAVSPDRYQLPEAVADSAAELARITGENLSVIRSSVSHKRKKGADVGGKRSGRYGRYYRVEIEEE